MTASTQRPARPMLTTVQAEIDLPALQHNFAVARGLAGTARVLAVIKADAYGHGMLDAAKALAGQADGFAVARLEEALRLRDAGFDQRLLLLGSLLDSEDLTVCGARRIDVVIHDPDTVQRVIGHRGPALNVWLKLDSGMRRLGLDPDNFRAAHLALTASPAVQQLLHISHFSHADTPAAEATDLQLRFFQQLRQQLDAEDTPLSQANSAALISRPDCRAQWVRPGIMLYGDNPLADRHPLPLRPVMRLRARILAVRSLVAGEAVGYGGDWIAQRPSRIATVGIGYADGYPRHAPSGTPTAIAGHIAPLAGRVSMDSIGIDVTGLPPVAVGDAVELWGEQVSVADVARRAGTISYSLLAGISPRVPRIVAALPGSTGTPADSATAMR